MKITKEMFLEGTLSLKEPELLSRKNKGFLDYSLKLADDDVKSLCQILMHPQDEIFIEHNLREITSYGSIKLNDKEYKISSSRVKDILLYIKGGEFEKNAVLHDLSKLLGKHDPEELEIKVKAYNYLLDRGIIKIR